MKEGWLSHRTAPVASVRPQGNQVGSWPSLSASLRLFHFFFSLPSFFYYLGLPFYTDLFPSLPPNPSLLISSHHSFSSTNLGHFSLSLTLVVVVVVVDHFLSPIICCWLLGSLVCCLQYHCGCGVLSIALVIFRWLWLIPKRLITCSYHLSLIFPCFSSPIHLVPPINISAPSRCRGNSPRVCLISLGLGCTAVAPSTF